jgi:hypothetical protein
MAAGAASGIAPASSTLASSLTATTSSLASGDAAGAPDEDELHPAVAAAVIPRKRTHRNRSVMST